METARMNVGRKRLFMAEKDRWLGRSVHRHQERDFGLARLARAPQRAAGICSGVLAVLQNLLAVDKNMLHPDRVLVRSIKGRTIADCRWIKHHDISKHF